MHALLLLALSSNLVTNGSFEEPYVGAGWVVLPGILGWVVDEGPGLELQLDNGGPPAAGRQLLELDSHNAADARTAIHQDVRTRPGATYWLGLAYAPRPGVVSNDIRVSWNGEVLEVLEGQGQMHLRWTYYRWRVVARSATSRIALADVGEPDSVGGLLDDVTLVLDGARGM